MAPPPGLRDRKKAQTRRLLVDTAARLFADHGFDGVSMVDVARAAEVSDQTVYNYFAAKQDLVFDRADQIRERYRSAVLERPDGTTPAAALQAVGHQDVERYRNADRQLARGEFPALCVSSSTIRRFALEVRDQQADAVAAAIVETDPDLHPATVRAHAAALISVFQTMFDQIGRHVLDGSPPGVTADELTATVDLVFDDLDRHFRTLTPPGQT